MVFIYLEKAYDRVPHEVLWECLEKNEVLITCIQAIKDVYEDIKASARTSGSDTEDFPIDIDLQQWSALSPFLFIIVIKELIKGMRMMDIKSRRIKSKG